MTTRRRWIAGLIIAFLVGTMAVGWFGSRGGNPNVKLVFLRYTNAPVIRPSTDPNFQYSTSICIHALFLATNAGSVPVRYVMVQKMDGPSIANACLYYDNWMLPAVLKPGESAIARTFWPTGQSRWRAAIGLRPDGLRDRLADKFGKRGFDRLQKAVAPSPFSDEVFWTYSDWLTNPPSARLCRLSALRGHCADAWISTTLRRWLSNSPRNRGSESQRKDMQVIIR